MSNDLENPPQFILNPEETAPTQSKSYCFLISSDFRSPAFSLKEANGNIIDIQESFVPSPTWRTLIFRTILLIYTIASITMSIISSKQRWIWIGFLTSWSAIFTVMYQLGALACTIKPSLLVQSNSDEQPNVFVRVLWLMYSISTVFELCISFFYWTLLYEAGDPISFASVSTHGLLAVILLLDGFAIAAIPMRLQQLPYVMLTALIYLIWQVIHAFAGIGIRRENNIGAPLYDVLDWKKAPVFAGVMSICTIFIMIPVVFFMVWTISMYSPPFTFHGNNRKVKADTKTENVI